MDCIKIDIDRLHKLYDYTGLLSWESGRTVKILLEVMGNMELSKNISIFVFAHSEQYSYDLCNSFRGLLDSYRFGNVFENFRNKIIYLPTNVEVIFKSIRTEREVTRGKNFIAFYDNSIQAGLNG